MEDSLGATSDVLLRRLELGLLEEFLELSDRERTQGLRIELAEAELVRLRRDVKVAGGLQALWQGLTLLLLVVDLGINLLAENVW
jgi:hypothetical protein